MSTFTDKNVVLAAGITLLSLAFVFILCICCILSKIKLAVSVIEVNYIHFTNLVSEFHLLLFAFPRHQLVS